MPSCSPCASCQHLRQLLENPDPQWFRAHGWSPARVAEAVGVHRSTVSRWFADGSTIPAAAKYDIARLAIQIACEGGRHEY